MAKLIEMIGYETDNLIVVGIAEKKKCKDYSPAFQWDCICKHCGNHFSATGRNIRQEKVKSCGCKTFYFKSKVHKKHGMFGSRLYLSWAHMISRCYNEKVSSYKNYGGRGISVCDEWKNSFENFMNWSIENGYNDELTLDRINNDGNYEPSNCRWSSRKEQVRNRRTTVFVEVNGEKKPLIEWCEIYKAKYSTVYNSIFFKGVRPEEALKKYSRR